MKNIFKALAIGGLLFAFTSSVSAKGDHGDKMKMMDSNKDQKVSAEEHAVGVAARFKTMDADGDGKVTATEMEAAHKDKMMGNMMGKMKGHHKMSPADKIAKMDTDKDGALTAQEHDAGAKTMFTEMDTDKDGFLTAAEMTAGHDKMMKK